MKYTHRCLFRELPGTCSRNNPQVHNLTKYGLGCITTKLFARIPAKLAVYANIKFAKSGLKILLSVSHTVNHVS
jgi:hypothetical protein